MLFVFRLFGAVSGESADARFMFCLVLVLRRLTWALFSVGGGGASAQVFMAESRSILTETRCGPPVVSWRAQLRGPGNRPTPTTTGSFAFQLESLVLSLFRGARPSMLFEPATALGQLQK